MPQEPASSKASSAAGSPKPEVKAPSPPSQASPTFGKVQTLNLLRELDSMVRIQATKASGHPFAREAFNRIRIHINNKIQELEKLS